MREYIYNETRNIRSNRDVEIYPQDTLSGVSQAICVLRDVEYKNYLDDDWVSVGLRWCISSPDVDVVELTQWILNYGLKPNSKIIA